MRLLLRNPWVRMLLGIFLCGLVASPVFVNFSLEATMKQYSGLESGQESFLNTMLLNYLGLPLVFALTAGSAIALLGLAAFERMRQPRHTS